MMYMCSALFFITISYIILIFPYLFIICLMKNKKFISFLFYIIFKKNFYYLISNLNWNLKFLKEIKRNLRRIITPMFTGGEGTQKHYLPKTSRHSDKETCYKNQITLVNSS